MSDHRIGLRLITDVLDALHRHGFTRGDDEHAGRADVPIGDLARIYEGSQDYPTGPALNQALSPRSAPEPPGQDSQVALSVPVGDLRTVLAALDIAADHKRDRAQMCPDCPDQSCPACQSRLQDAEAYDQVAEQMCQAADTALAAHRGRVEPVCASVPPRQRHPAADKEAGQ